MKLVSWNCKGAFRRKQIAISRFDADILVLPEAERLDDLSHVIGHRPIRSVHWIGDNPRKGLGVLSYGDFVLRVHPSYDPRLRWILPLHVEGPRSFTLFAVWAMPDAQSRRYVPCVFDTLNTYRDLIEAPNVVVAGDFNCNVDLDRATDSLTFADLVRQFETAGLHSLYHRERGLAFGSEPDATFYMYHRIDRPFHLDYVFADHAMTDTGFTLAIGDHGTWSKSSDHMPLIGTFGNRPQGP